MTEKVVEVLAIISKTAAAAWQVAGDDDLLRRRPIGERDLLIASIALAAHLTLVTPNAAEFSRVPKLRVEDWTAS